MKKMFTMLLVVAMMCGLLVGCSGDDGITADNYYDEPLTFLVHAAAGGNLDIKVRIIAQYLEEEIGQTIVIENLAGASGATAATEYLNEEANSRTILVMGDAMFSIMPHSMDVEYTEEDFEPIIGLDVVKAGLFVNPDTFTTYEEYVEYGQENTILFGDNGKASGSYLAPAMFNEAADVLYEGITYDSAAEALTAVYAGHIDACWASMALGEQYVSEGTLIPLVTFAPETYTYADGTEVPSAYDLGLDVEHQNFIYFAARGGSDEELVDMLYEAFNTVYQDEDLISDLADVGVELYPLNGEEIDVFMDETVAAIADYYEANE